MLIRRERSEDAAEVRSVVSAAFGAATHIGGSVPEADLVDALRTDESWLKQLSFVAVDDGGVVVGHVLATRGRVDRVPALGLGPLSVHPDNQGCGVGTGLMHTVLGAADALDEALIVLLGEPSYYGRFGFRAAEQMRIRPPVAEWANYFQAKPLAAYDDAITGTFAYPRPFAELPA